jgi:P pilus assembly chaperone PapD
MSKLTSIAKILLPVISMAYCVSAHAAFSLSGTRFIYNSQQKNISLQVTNDGNTLYGGQVWIGNGDHPSDKVYFIPAPAFFTLQPNQTQIVRLINVDNKLPQNKESLFWLNVQEIPQAVKNKGDEGSLQIAMDTRVKLLYRPQDLQAARSGAEQKTQIEDVNGKAVLKNPTPYYFAVVDVTNNGKPLALSANTNQNLAEFKPFSSINLDVNYSQIHDLTVKAINDYGAVVTYRLNKG